MRSVVSLAWCRPSRRDCNSVGLEEQASGFEDLRGYNVNEAADWPGVRTQAQRAGRRSRARLWLGAGTAIAAAGLAWLAYSYRESDAAIQAAPQALPQVVVSKPLVRELDSRLGFLGQFSAPPPRSAQLGVASDDLVELLGQPPTAAAGLKLATAIRRPLRLNHHTGRALAGSTGRSLSAAFDC